MGVHCANEGVVVSQTEGLTHSGSGGGTGAEVWSMELATRAMRDVEFEEVIGWKVIEVLNLERMSFPNKGRGH